MFSFPVIIKYAKENIEIKGQGDTYLCAKQQDFKASYDPGQPVSPLQWSLQTVRKSLPITGME